MKEYHKTLLNISDSVHRFFNRTFSQVVISGPALEPQRIKAQPVMIAGTHRSHADYFILGQIMHDRGVDNMRFAAGENLTTLPWIGPRFCSFGAFSVKRGSTFGRAYLRRLCEQVVEMLLDGDNIMVFPEGGRSYSGEMLELKGGIIGAAVLAQARNPQKQVAFLPVAVSYEQLPELPYFATIARGRALRGSKNPFRRLVGTVLYFGADIVAFVKFTNAWRLRKKYGKVYIDYGDLIRVGEMVDIQAGRIADARDEFSAQRVSMQIVGEKLQERFLQLYRILPMHVLARALFDRGNARQDALEAACATLIQEARAKGRNVVSVETLGGGELVAVGVAQLGYTKCIKRRGGTILIVKPDIIRYYAGALS